MASVLSPLAGEEGLVLAEHGLEEGEEEESEVEEAETELERLHPRAKTDKAIRLSCSERRLSPLEEKRMTAMCHTIAQLSTAGSDVRRLPLDTRRGLCHLAQLSDAIVLPKTLVRMINEAVEIEKCTYSAAGQGTPNVNAGSRNAGQLVVESETDRSSPLGAAGGIAVVPARIGLQVVIPFGVRRTMRRLVSKRKRRFSADGFDLDLSYITPRVIAMGFPSSGAQATYRNPRAQVKAFLEQRHYGRYMVFNLCSERSYDKAAFQGRLQVFPFDDHTPPPLHMIPVFCQCVSAHLAQHSENIVAIHCRAGKGRTGVMISSWLLHSGEFTNALSALDWFSLTRTRNRRGVTIPSQRRYVEYFQRVMSQLGPSSELPHIVARLKWIRLHSFPDMGSNRPCLPGVAVEMRSPNQEVGCGAGLQLIFKGTFPLVSNESRPQLTCLGVIALATDVRITLFVGGPSQGRKMFEFWFHPLGMLTCSGLAEEMAVVLHKCDLDFALKDMKCMPLPRDFYVELGLEKA